MLTSSDGGGIRGLSSIMILQEILARYNARRGAKGLRPQEPWEIFDLIGGAGTGGYGYQEHITIELILAAEL